MQSFLGTFLALLAVASGQSVEVVGSQSTQKNPEYIIFNDPNNCEARVDVIGAFPDLYDYNSTLKVWGEAWQVLQLHLPCTTKSQVNEPRRAPVAHRRGVGQQKSQDSGTSIPVVVNAQLGTYEQPPQIIPDPPGYPPSLPGHPYAISGKGWTSLGDPIFLGIELFNLETGMYMELKLPPDLPLFYGTDFWVRYSFTYVDDCGTPDPSDDETGTISTPEGGGCHVGY